MKKKTVGVVAVFLVVVLVWVVTGGRPLFRRTVGEDIRSTGRDVADSIRRVVQ